VVTLAHAVTFFHEISVCLLLDCRVEVIAVLLCRHYFLHLAVLKFALVCFPLPFDYGSPLVQVSPRIFWVVPLSVFLKGLEFLAFMFKWLLNSLRSNLEGVDQIVCHLF